MANEVTRTLSPRQCCLTRRRRLRGGSELFIHAKYLAINSQLKSRSYVYGAGAGKTNIVTCDSFGGEDTKHGEVLLNTAVRSFVILSALMEPDNPD